MKNQLLEKVIKESKQRIKNKQSDVSMLKQLGIKVDNKWNS